MEAQQKATRSKRVKLELDAKINRLKLVEASCVAKELMNARHQYFEYRDKPNKHLDGVLAESRGKQTVPEVMISDDGKGGGGESLKDVLKVFSDYYNIKVLGQL